MNHRAKILIVDDESDVLEFVSYYFHHQGYMTFTAKDGLEAIQVARIEKPDLFIIDVKMPRLDGFALAEYLCDSTEFKDTLIVFLTGLSDELSELRGFAAGADDYVTKPIKPKLLLSRVQALLRRKLQNESLHSSLQIGNLIIDQEKRQVLLNEKKVVISKREFDLLNLLASKPGRVFSKIEILNNIWQTNEIHGVRAIDIHVKKIRSKIGNEAIKTVKGIGYKLDF